MLLPRWAANSPLTLENFALILQPPSHSSGSAEGDGKGDHLSAGACSLAKLAWEQVRAPDLHLSVRAWGPVLALCPSCCATLGRELHLSETWLLLRERGLTTPTFDSCCGIKEAPRKGLAHSGGSINERS